MKNVDIARVSFDPEKNFSRVVKQQGRVELESDANEQVEITLRAMRLMMKDLVGPHGGPERACGFRVLVPEDGNARDVDEATAELLKGCDGGDFVLSRGRYYVDGLLCENHAPVRYTRQPDMWHRPLAPSERHCHLVYLDVWEQSVTALEDPGIREPALSGVDTAARMRVFWQVRSLSVAKSDEAARPRNSCPGDLSPTWAEHLQTLQPQHRGAMVARTRPVDPEFEVDEDDAAHGTFRGVENQLYRVEIHRGGKLGDTDLPPTFKWSRDNGTVAYAVESAAFDDGRQVQVTLTGWARDDTAALAAGQVVEFNGNAEHAHHLIGALFEVASVESGRRSLTLTQLAPPDGKVVPIEVRPAAEESLVLRRWDQGATARKNSGMAIVEGAVVIEEGRWLEIEDGIEVRFEALKGKARHVYRAGDYWLVTARVVTNEVEWPRKNGKPLAVGPLGVKHHYAPLALLDVTASETLRLAPLTRRFGYHRLKELARDVFARDGD
ncbi:MAG: DUF6519 domain-containing protein [Leptothrix sp. (in: b-proteobacteria)]